MKCYLGFFSYFCLSPPFNEQSHQIFHFLLVCLSRSLEENSVCGATRFCYPENLLFSRIKTGKGRACLIWIEYTNAQLFVRTSEKCVALLCFWGSASALKKSLGGPKFAQKDSTPPRLCPKMCGFYLGCKFRWENRWLSLSCGCPTFKSWNAIELASSAPSSIWRGLLALLRRAFTVCF